MRGTLLISLFLSLLAVLFALQNAEPIDVEFGPFAFTGSTAFIVLATFVLGVVVGILATLPARFKSKLTLWRLKKDLKKKDHALNEPPPGEEAEPVLEAHQEPPEAPMMLPPEPLHAKVSPTHTESARNEYAPPEDAPPKTP
jgi:putative membrane protein